ncbi:MGH1-like glycoside hydrolase domain-containing protein [Longispora albida]|uniref:MGH1-like glycoside hydrolase domain-containing protein n=1 Tax=Longispora albida TaxID=203523 RepID=UPI0003A6F53C|nr:trehalase family glycosidase [Longispora albida]
MRRRTFVAASVAAAGVAAASLPPAASAAAGPETPGAGEFADVLDLRGVPSGARPPSDNPISVFADLGAWHGYGLGDGHGFSGPLYIAEEYPWWLSEAFTRIGLTEDGAPVALTPSAQSSQPGVLRQELTGDGLLVVVELRFASNRTALVQACVRNTGQRTRRVSVSWSGRLLRHTTEPIRSAPSLAATPSGVAVNFSEVRETWRFFSTASTRFEVRHAVPVSTTVTGDSYVTRALAPLSIPAGAERPLTWTETYSFTAADRDAAVVEAALAKPSNAATAASRRWAGYLHAGLAGVAPGHRRLAAKAIVTLVTNWRSPAGALRSDGITPSISFVWFSGLWSWDSWKTAVGVAAFSPALATSVIESMFDFQRPDGMIPDCVFYNDPAHGGGNWNERNTKPPLAAWAVWQVYSASGDKDFLRRIYPRLVSYHKWWYAARDHDGDGICGYGATIDPANDTDEAIIEAAAWESGMDNAPRFDAATVSHTAAGHTINQESVDLNAYLFAEKDYLTRIARALRLTDSYPAAAIATRIREKMYDPATGWFYDIDSVTKRPLVERGKAVEGVIPVWAGLASAEQAAAVRAALLDPAKFGTRVPVPTVSADNPAFDPVAYWRGPVWLDQAYFAITGLRAAGYAADADALTARLVANADGLAGDAPIHENYQPLTGERLNAPNFSWSAALLLALLRA